MLCAYSVRYLLFRDSFNSIISLELAIAVQIADSLDWGVHNQEGGELMRKVFDLQTVPNQRFSIEQGSISNHHFCRVTVDIGRRIENKKEHTITYVVEEVVGEGVSKRSHKDRKDDYVGKTLALSRALESLAHKVERRAWGKVKHNDDMKVQRAEKKEERREQLKNAQGVFFPTLFQQVFTDGENI